jgi:two-component system, cell cycle response regulator
MALVDVPERSIRLTTAILVPCFAAIGVVAALSPEGPHSPTRLIVVGLIYATTVPVGFVIARTRLGKIWRQEPARHGQFVTMAFVGYADISLSAVLLTFVDRAAGIYGTALFAIIGVYAGHFINRRIVIVHVAFTSIIITVLAWLTWRQGHHDAPGVAARWMVSMLSANCTLGMLSGYTSGVQKAFDTQLDNATRDHLTGLLNRRGLELWAEQLLRTSSQTVGFIIVDLDHFKSVNDSHGHGAGDSVLVLVATRLRDALGADATIARTGGEEFAVVLGKSHEETLDAAHAIRIVVRDLNDEIPVTVSVGVSAVAASESVRNDPIEALSEGLRRADTALYEAKHAGRNRVHVYDQPGDETGSWPDRRQRRGH